MKKRAIDSRNDSTSRDNFHIYLVLSVVLVIISGFVLISPYFGQIAGKATYSVPDDIEAPAELPEEPQLYEEPQASEEPEVYESPEEISALPESSEISNTINSPSDNSLITESSVVFSGKSSSSAGIKKIIFEVEDLIQPTAIGAEENWAYVWDTSSLPEGDFNVKITAVDSNNFKSTEEITLSKPRTGSEQAPPVYLPEDYSVEAAGNYTNVITIYPTDDTYSQTSDTSHNGYETSFSARNNYLSHLKFSISRIPANATINSAELGMFHWDDLNGGHNKENYTLFSVLNDSWSETSCYDNSGSGKNCPDASSIIAKKSPSGADDADYWQTFEVKSFVESQYAGDKITSFILNRTNIYDSDSYCRFYSKEQGYNTPYLKINYTSANPEPPVIGLNKSIIFNSESNKTQISFLISVTGSPFYKITPVDVVLVMDRSGSMGWDTPTRISQTKVAAKTLVDILDSATQRSGLVSFNQDATLDESLTFDKQSIKNSIDSLSAGGYTAIGNGINLSTQHLMANGRTSDDVIWFEVVLTDGNNNRGMDPLIAAQIAASHNITAYVVGLGTEINETILKGIANITGGKYYFAPTGNELMAIYEDIGREISSIAAKNTLLVDVMFPEVVEAEQPLPENCANSTQGNSSVMVCSVEDLSIGDLVNVIFNVTIAEEESSLNLTNLNVEAYLNYTDIEDNYTQQFFNNPPFNISFFCIDNDSDTYNVSKYTWLQFLCGPKDCNDSNSSINSGATEICDGIDNDCDDSVDEGFDPDDCDEKCGFVWTGALCCGDDLNEDDPYEANETTCDDSHDNDCDGYIDDYDSDCVNCIDNDNDGYSVYDSVYCKTGNDCDDNNYAINPGATEICDGIDNDCDDSVDEGFDPDDCDEKCEYTWTGNGGALSCCGDDSGEDNPYEIPETSCSDGNDNDCDGYTDYYDIDCGTPPVVSIISPLDGSSWNQNIDNIVFSAAGSDTDGYVASYEWESSIDGLLYTSGAGNTSTFNTSSLSLGTHTINVTATDNHGFTDSDSITIVVKEAVYPTASITNPAGGDHFKYSYNVTFVGIATDSDGFVASENWYSGIDGIIGSGSTFTTNSLSVGTHVITYSVEDNEGLVTNNSITIIINALLEPSASITSPLDGSDYKYGQNITFSGTGDDSDGNITGYLWESSIDGILGADQTFTLSNLSVGLHTITFTTIDNDGLNTSRQVTIEVKALVAPTASIVTPNDGDNFFYGNNITFSGSGSDPDGNITQWQWSSDRDGVIGYGQSMNYDNLSLGLHTITLTVTDDDGLQYVDTSSIEIIVNPAYAPTASIISPLDDSQFREGQMIIFSGVGTDTNGNVVSYLWESDLDGTLYTSGADSTSTFNTSLLSVGIHDITLVVKDNDNQTGQDSIKITVLDNQSPTASILAPHEGDHFKVTDLITFSGLGDGENITAYSWTSNLDGALSTEQTFSAYLTPGEHTLTLLVTDDDNQTDEKSIIITVNELEYPVVSITSPLAGDYKYSQNITFSGTADDPDGNISSYSWVSSIDGVIGNSGLFTLSNLSVGMHTITFVAVDDDGLASTDEVVIEIKALKAPTASIITPNNFDSFYDGDNIIFSGSGSDPDGTIALWQWSSSIDGVFGYGQTLYYNNLSLGYHTITLTVTDDDGLQFVDVASIEIFVNPLFAPSASIISPLDDSQFRDGQEITFSGVGTDTNGIVVSYGWSSDLDGVLYSSGAGSSSTFNANLSVGVHDITLLVRDDDGQTGQSSITITVLDNNSPTASIVSPADGDHFKVTDLITFSGLGDNENIVSYSWTSSLDGALSTEPAFTSSLTAGEHIITLLVTDDDNQTDSVSITITVNELEYPVVSITSPLDGSDYKYGQPITFSGVATDPDGNITFYSWVSNIDGVIGDSETFTTSNLSAGLHTITFIAVDDDGLASTYEITIEVKALVAPTASILTPNDGDNFFYGNDIIFSGSGSDPDGNIVLWQWGSSIDGNIGYGQSISYDSLSLGLHTITLTVTDDDGLQYVDTSSIEIIVNPAYAPTASIVSPLDDSQFREGQEITFSGVGTDTNGNITEYYWSSDIDGLLHVSYDPDTSTFSTDSISAGTHDITLLVTDNDGQTGQSSITITVLDSQSPTASIVSPSDGDHFKVTDLIIFSGLGDGENITSYSWTSNLDGALSNDASFVASLTPGEHTITLLVTDDDNQTDSVSITITVNELMAPTASILLPVDESDYKEGAEIIFRAVASDPDGEIVSYSWVSDIDGVIGDSLEFSASNLSAGLHTITFIAVDDDNLTSTYEITVTVKSLEAPTASIIKPDEGNHFKEGEMVEFIGSGSDPDGNIVSWQWSSSIDGLFGTEQSFNYSGLSLGRHDISLTVVDDDEQQFTDTFTIWIEVDPLLSPNVTISSPVDDSSYRFGMPVLFDSNVTDEGSIVYYSWASDLDGVIASGEGIPSAFNYSNLTIGYHEITLTVIDDDNMTSSAVVSIWIAPLTAPNVTIISPLDNSSFNSGDSILFSALITDDGSIASIVWNSDLDGNIGFNESFYATLTPGEHRITLVVTDDDNLTTVVTVTSIIVYGFCGDGIINSDNEECEAEDLGGKDCTDFNSFTKGTLRCTEACKFDTSGCSKGGGGGGGGDGEVCTPDWECTAWMPDPCNVGEMQTRQCTDANNCHTTYAKPAEESLCSQIPIPPEVREPTTVYVPSVSFVPPEEEVVKKRGIVGQAYLFATSAAPWPFNYLIAYIQDIAVWLAILLLLFLMLHCCRRKKEGEIIVEKAPATIWFRRHILRKEPYEEDLK